MQYVIIGGLLVLYLFILFFMPVPGCPTGYIGPGGLALPANQSFCTGGAHSYIDKQILGPHHMYHSLAPGNVPVSSATCGDTYHCGLHDPEGILGMLTACVLTYTGMHAGRIIVHYKHVSPSAMMVRWVVSGVILAGVGALLCGFSKNDGALPLNKNLWSPSFIAVMGGTGSLMLALTYVLVDYRRWWSGVPFRYVGMNSIIVYAGSEILQVSAFSYGSP